MKRLWRHYTFNDWDRGYSSEPITLSKEELELNGYQSTYVQMYNILKETGWKRKGGKWHSPHSSASYQKIDEAYNSQKLWEIIR